jgi:hypothetical protein
VSCIEFMCGPGETFDPQICDCVDLAERDRVRCASMPHTCASGTSSCGECSDMVWESFSCAFWIGIAVFTPGGLGLFTALNAGNWAAAAEAAGSIAGQQALQELKLIPGVDSCLCVATKVIEGCAKNLCSILEYARGERGNFCW